jgi:salicylate biosynthesis isochorismate synthase
VRAAEHLFASGKDLEEHALVVRGIVDALLPLASSVEAGNWPDVRAAGSLAHLSTAIAADLRAGVSAFDLIDALHPTPAVGGLPRDAALRFIRRFESDPRGLYAAPVGWLEPGGDACLAVGIRSALLRPGQARVFAGAGIVAASDPAAEWEETGAKLRWLGEMLETGG